LEKLQDWILSILVVGKFENSQYFSKLNLEYLELGGWLVSDRINSVLVNPILTTRLLISHSIVRLISSCEKIQGLFVENINSMVKFCDYTGRLFERGINLFLPVEECDAVRLGIEGFESSWSVLSPKQIVILGRYCDQRRLIEEDLTEVNLKLFSIETPQDILEYAIALEDIVSKSSYDEGNINYDLKKVYSTQFSIVKTLEQLNDDFTVLTIDGSEHTRTVLQDIQYDVLTNSEWGTGFPTIILKESVPSNNSNTVILPVS
jgi:hypothetical protein